MEAPQPSRQVVEAVARREGVPPNQLPVPLYDVVDAEALDTLLRNRAERENSRLAITFEYLEYEVQVAVSESTETEVTVNVAPLTVDESPRPPERDVTSNG